MTLTDFKQVDFKSFNPKKDIFYLILFIIALVICAFLLKKQEKDKLINFKYMSATVTEKSKIYLGGYNVKYSYRLKSKNFFYENSVKINDYNKIEIGDTILIKYSLDDNSIAEVVNYNWNEDLRKK